ncbi:hypothetical protein HB999_06545 [Listeria booriae]|uniref:hypothetical protein n=1 Tax=Listeria booriae TaxID=1552123 RepID=UPI00164D0D7D|nr:hypothetical protein [Listeria booriae]MBC6163121.1 hypothetical protein [Listeria booriae]
MNLGPLSKINDYPNKNFYGGRYNTRVLQEDTIFYRGGKADAPLGQWFASEPPKSIVNVRVDSAVKVNGSILKQEN